MEIVNLAQIATENGFLMPDFPFLHADCRTFESLILQPAGHIIADRNGIHNVISLETNNKYDSFLLHSKQIKADLTVTPEYSCPWPVLLNIIADPSRMPGYGKLWAIGCESFSKDFLSKLPMFEHVHWIFDEEVLQNSGSFFDPLCYIFKTNTSGQVNNPVYIALLQFKTIEMSDHNFLERNHLIRGRYIYKIESNGHSNGLCTLICSDALNTNDNIIEELINSPTHILHIQLNSEPRDPQFAQYRIRSLSKGSDTVEIFTINWAKNTSFAEPYNGISFSEAWGTAIYSKSQQITLSNTHIAHNHHNGAFLCYWHEHKTWVYYFDNNEAIYRLRLTPVSQRLAQGQLARRSGLEILEVKNWTNGLWSIAVLTQIEVFQEVCDTYNVPNLCITSNGMLDVVNIERLLTLSLGMATCSQWQKVPQVH